MTAEKKFVVENLHFSYNGVFDIIEFFKTVEAWVKEKDREIDIKKRLEHIEPEGKKIEYFVELWKEEEAVYRSIVRVKALFNNITEVEIKKGKSKRKLNKGNVHIKIDGLLETNWEGNWHQKTVFTFWRGLFDRFIYNIHDYKYVDKVTAEAEALHKRLQGFFGMYGH